MEVEGIQRIRLMYVYPNNITDELLDLIAREEKICNYLDMPIQHISDGILKTMGRRITGDVIKSLIDKARQKIPGIVFRTSLITGFPGEKEEDFARLLEFVKTYKIEQLGVFAYSREEGTPAWQLPQQIPQKTKEARRKKLMTAQFQNVLERNEARVGQVMEILVDDFDGIFFEGRSCSEALDVDPVILVKYDEEIRIGEIYPVRIVQTNDYDLIGEMESEFTQ